MKKTIRLLSLMLAVLLVLGMFAGCAKKEEQPAADTPATQEKPAQTTTQEETPAETSEEAQEWSGNMDELYVIDILAPSPLLSATLDTTLGKYIAEQFGIAFNYVTYAGDIREKQAMMLAGGDYNEIQYMQNDDMVTQYIQAGALINLDDYKDLLPDFYERYAELIPYWRASAPDGGLYKWEYDTPKVTETCVPHNDILVRTDVLEYYGWPELVTASDWKEFLTQAVQDFPTTYDGQSTVGMTLPMAESYGPATIPIGYEKGDRYIGAGSNYVTFNVQDMDFDDCLLTPEVKESFQFFNDLYTEGVLDEECFTDTADITLQKMSNGSAIAVWYVTWYKDGANNALTSAGHPEMSYIQMPFQLDSQAGHDYVMATTYSYPFNSYGITTNCQDPERVCRFINWCCTEEGQVTLQSGIEGVHYTVKDGKRVPTELGTKSYSDQEVRKVEGVAAMTALPKVADYAADGQPYDLSQTWAFRDANLTEREKEAFAALGWNSSNEWWNNHQRAINSGFCQSCTLDPTSDLGKVGAKMAEVRIKYTANLIMASDFEDVWQELMAEYDKLDHEAVVNALNEALAELNAGLQK